ncbi:hypothetical protein C8R43DRAFT_1123136 [Mycena crocata]|nr:hypothetical protein C8R43DRAFT_1123136 [Mycena crocata]
MSTFSLFALSLISLTQPFSSQPPPGFQFVQQGPYYQQQAQPPPGYTLVPNGWAGPPNQQGAPQGNPPAYGGQIHMTPQENAQMQMMQMMQMMQPQMQMMQPQMQMQMMQPQISPQENATQPSMVPQDSAQGASVIDPTLLAMGSDLLTLSQPSTPIANRASDDLDEPANNNADVGDNSSDSDPETDKSPPSSPAKSPNSRRTPSTPTPKPKKRATTQALVTKALKKRAVRVSATNATHGFVLGALKGRNAYQIFRRKALPKTQVANPSRHFRITFPTIVDRLERLVAETGAYIAIGGTSRGVDSGVVTFVSNSFRSEAAADATRLVNDFIKSAGAIKRARGTEALSLTKDLMQTEADKLELARASEAALVRAASAEKTVDLQAQIIARLQAKIAGTSQDTDISVNP